MDTFLDVWINEVTVQWIVVLTKREPFAWECHRRFLQSHGMTLDLKRDDFDAIKHAVIYGWYDNELGGYVNMLGDRTVSIAENI